ncbi:GNAT family N-acetyltransferase [Paraburkholderia sediminicola]|uniref:GNAT family N-acetyltransferase n=1 Tax=Paraburkholderia sediminicola TaxID=458836 RepID=UPI0038BE16BC
MEVSTMQMPKPLASHRVDPLIVEAWVTGWALSRRTAAPTVLPMGFRVDVGLPQHNARYVLPAFQPEVVTDLASRIDAPWTFIKVCAEPRTVAEVLPKTWTVEAPVFMMTAALADNECSQGERILPNGYAARVFDEGPILRVQVEDAAGEIAAGGQCAQFGESCIFDQIVTHESHRRRGLGSAIMKLLSGEAVARGKKQGILVATADGLALYSAIGWTVHSPVASAVIIPAEGSVAGREDAAGR